MSNALQICADAYAEANLDQTLTSFSTTQEFPYNIAKTLINTVIKEMDRMGEFWFCETSVSMPYSPSTSSWNLTTLAAYPIDAKRITRVRTEATNYWNELTELNYRKFQALYRVAAIPSAQPQRWAKYQNTVYTDSSPDQDYSLNLYYFQDMPLVASETDTLLVPTKDEDVVREGVFAYLCQRIGRPDYQLAYELYMQKVKTLLVTVKKDVGLPTQMPASF